MKTLFRILKLFTGVILSIVLVFCIYYAYMALSYYRIEDNLELETISTDENNLLLTNTSYSISTYNIGFGAYEQNYSFFMDTGEMLDGTKTKGKYSRALAKDNVIANTNGSIEAIKKLNCDFMLFQEVDTSSTRSFKINQQEMIYEAFKSYSKSYAVNFHSSYLFYPLTSPHGIANSGIASLSKFDIASSTRIQLPISEGMISKFVDLDRCLAVNRFTVAGKELVIINAHLSAYDEGGVFRKKQIDLLNSIMTEEKEKGNYVIIGGDFNQDIAASKELFPTTQKTPSWIFDLCDDDLADGYSIVKSTNAPTCRGADIFYTKGVTHTVVVDGFIISDNIQVDDIQNIDLDFLYSDHNPVKLNFTLK